MKNAPLALATLAFALGACAPAAAPVSAPAPVEIAPPRAPAVTVAAARADESFREHPPAAEAPHPFAPPVAARRKLRNGIPVLMVRQPSQYVAIRIVAAGGVLDVGPDKFEIVAQMVRGFRAGTTKHSYHDLQGTLAALVMPEPGVAWFADAVSISVLVPTTHLRAGIELLADLALRPSFDKTETARWREQDALDADPKNDGVIADQVMRRVLFGSHGYAAAAVSASRTRAVTRADVVALHARLFEASRLSITAAGGAEDSEILAALEEAFGAAPAHGSSGRGPTTAAPQPPAGPRLVVVDRPGTTIATIATSTQGPAFGSPGFEATSLALDALTDRGFGRITMRLRDQLGHVPGIMTTSSSMRVGGSCGWQMRAPTDRVAPALVEADRILRDFATRGPPDDELADVKARGVLAFTSWFETSGDTARAFSWPLLFQQQDDWIARRPARFAAVSMGDVRAAATRYFDADRMRTVIVGDWATLQTSLTALGWGPVELRTPEGVVVTPGRGTRAAR